MCARYRPGMYRLQRGRSQEAMATNASDASYSRWVFALQRKDIYWTFLTLGIYVDFVNNRMQKLIQFLFSLFTNHPATKTVTRLQENGTFDSIHSLWLEQQKETKGRFKRWFRSWFKPCGNPAISKRETSYTHTRMHEFVWRFRSTWSVSNSNTRSTRHESKPFIISYRNKLFTKLLSKVLLPFPFGILQSWRIHLNLPSKTMMKMTYLALLPQFGFRMHPKRGGRMWVKKKVNSLIGWRRTHSREKGNERGSLLPVSVTVGLGLKYI